MSGHSHWHKVRFAKGTADEKRGKLFSKLARLITIAAKEGGGDPEANSSLRIAVETAKKANMPKDNIEKAVKRGTGELAGEKLEEVLIEAYGPGGVALIIEGITDNKNRTVGELKQILQQHTGKLVEAGSVKWMFERKGAIALDLEAQEKEELTDKEALELAAIEAGADDVAWHETLLIVYTKPNELEQVKKVFEEQGITVESAGLDWVAKEMLA